MSTSSTDFLGLALTDALETSMSFLDWRLLMNGTQVDSNMRIIDRAVKALNTSVGGKADGFSFDTETGELKLQSGGVDIPDAVITLNLTNIQRNDLAQDVQDSLALADTALQDVDVSSKLDANQGAENYRKIMEVGEDGELSPQPSFKPVLFYKSLYDAVDDANASFSKGTDVAETSADAKVRVETHINGSTRMTLLSSYTETRTCSPAVDIVIDLAGYTITVTSPAGLIRRETSSVANVTIDGSTTNSAVVMSNITSANGAAELFRWGTNAQSPSDSSELRVYGGTYSITANCRQAMTFLVQSGNILVENCDISIVSSYYDENDSNTYYVVGAYLMSRGAAVIRGCNISAKYTGRWDSETETYIYGNSRTYGIFNYQGRLTVESTDSQTTISVDARYPNSGDSRNQYIIGINTGDGSVTYLKGINVNGLHSAVNNNGNLYVDGGIYQARGHGGFYFGGAGNTAMVQNATVRSGSYIGDLTPANDANWNNSAFYIGDDSNTHPNIFLDHCTFDSSSDLQYISFRTILDAKLHISNCNLPSGKYIRMDQLGTTQTGGYNIIYVGSGCNIDADRITLRYDTDGQSTSWYYVSSEATRAAFNQNIRPYVTVNPRYVLPHVVSTSEYYGFQWTNDESVIKTLFDKVDKNQGEVNAGKPLRVGEDGGLIPKEYEYQITGTTVKYTPKSIPIITTKIKSRQTGVGLPNPDPIAVSPATNNRNVRPFVPVTTVNLSVNTDSFSKTLPDVSEGLYNWSTGRLAETFGKIVFSGSNDEMSNFAVDTNSQGLTIFKYTIPSDYTYGYGVASGLSRCSHFIAARNGYDHASYNTCGLSATGQQYIFCYNASGTTNAEKLADFQDFLQYENTNDSPVTVEYELAQERVSWGTKAAIGIISGVNVAKGSGIITVSGEMDHESLFGNDELVGAKGILSGKTAVFFGDSVLGDYYTPYDYPSYIAKFTGLNVINAGFGNTNMSYTGVHRWLSMASLAASIYDGNWTRIESGVSSSDYNDIKWWGTETNYVQYKLSMLKALDWNTVDYIVINYGGNDWLGNIPIDNPSGPTSVTSSMLSATRSVILYILGAYPHIKIIFVTPLWRWWDEYTENNPSGVVSYTDSNTQQNSENKTLKEYCDALREMATEDYQIPCFDLYRACGFNQYNRHQYFEPYDGINPFPYYNGFEHIGRLISGFMLNPGSAL